MSVPSQLVGRGITDYSDRIEGTPQNHHWSVQFDVTDGYVGITQFESGQTAVRDRVLLSPDQFAALVAFVNDAQRHRKSSR